MSRCVRVYIEGGSTGRTADSNFRRGWKKFLMELHNLARENGFRSLEVVRGQGRNNTFEQFKNYRTMHPDDLCVLLVDSETSVNNDADVWSIVANRPGDNWTKPSWATEEHLYFMVPFVEAWLVTDEDALSSYFKRNFKAEKIIMHDVESKSKKFIENALKSATRGTPKGEYTHGMSHEIIEITKSEKVKTLYHGKRLFDKLTELIKSRRIP